MSDVSLSFQQTLDPPKTFKQCEDETQRGGLCLRASGRLAQRALRWRSLSWHVFCIGGKWLKNKVLILHMNASRSDHLGRTLCPRSRPTWQGLDEILETWAASIQASKSVSARINRTAD